MRFAALLTIVALAATACQGGSEAEPPGTTAAKPKPRFSEVPVRPCEDRVSGDLGSDWRRFTILAGPVGFVARAYEDERPGQFAALARDRYRGQKVLLLVRRSSRVTIVVPRAARSAASLLYDPARWNDRNAYRIADGDPAMTFQACEGLYGVRPHDYTQFNGSIIVAGARCLPLDVYAEGSDRPVRARISFGAGRCR